MTSLILPTPEKTEENGEVLEDKYWMICLIHHKPVMVKGDREWDVTAQMIQVQATDEEGATWLAQRLAHNPEGFRLLQTLAKEIILDGDGEI